jgi:UPF0271 protein
MIELNADIGEGCDDVRLMPFVDRVSIACGGHAGDAASMRAALALAQAHGVAAGAHPGYPDRVHFGRRALAAPAATVAAWVGEQLAALADEAARLGVVLAHVKPHGALYHAAAEDPKIADAIAGAVARFDARLALVGPAGSCLLAAARAAGLAALAEAFADRRYGADGRLVSRETPGAVIDRPADAVRQAACIARGEAIETVDGGRLRVVADTICVHGDNAHALRLVRAVRAALGR